VHPQLLPAEDDNWKGKKIPTCLQHATHHFQTDATFSKKHGGHPEYGDSKQKEIHTYLEYRVHHLA
jgi:hypothetical protein